MKRPDSNSKNTAPRLAHQFLSWIIKEDLVEEILGDLEEYTEELKDQPKWKQKLFFWFQFISFLRPYALKNLEGVHRLNNYGMFKNNLKIAFRNLVRYKTYVVINLMGMGFALACCIVAFLNLDYKLRFDEHHFEKTQDVYRVNTIKLGEKGSEKWGTSPLALGSALKADLKGMGQVVRLHGTNGIVKGNNKAFSEAIHYSDKGLFDSFNIPMLLGTSTNPEQVVLSESMAFKIFGDGNPIGHELKIIDSYQRENTYVIGGVSRELPENTSIQFNVLIPIDQAFEPDLFPEENWNTGHEISTFIKLAQGVEDKDVNKIMESYATKYNEFHKNDEVTEFYLQHFHELALTSDIDLPNWVRGRLLKRNAVGFLVGITSILSLLILITACFNFTNTSLAFSSSRLKEMGIRKVIGSSRFQLIKQFLIENMVLCMLGIVIGVIGAKFLIQGYNGLFEQQLDMRYIFRSRVIGYLLCLPIFTALFAGIYPALKISKYEPVKIFSGKNQVAKLGLLSKILLIAQFSISCFAIIGGIVLTQNASYQNHVDYGYDLKQVVVTQVNNIQEFMVFHNELEKNPDIQLLAGSAQIVGQSNEVEVKTNITDLVTEAQNLSVGARYLSTVGIDLISGRQFNPKSTADQKKSVIINQKMAQVLNIENDPINREILINESPFFVIGVVENHKEFGLSQAEPPCVFTLSRPENFKYLSVNVDPDNQDKVQSALRATWFKVNPDVVYQGFLQQMMIIKQFLINQTLRNLCFFLAIATAIMSAAGFFSMVSLTLVRRTREIGVRKVFGASISQMVVLVLKDFALFIFISFSIGATLSIVFIKGVLFQALYVYHVPLGVGAFAASLILMLLIPGLTVGLKIFNVANTNPSKTLRYE